jgi:hypothetical protein
MKTDAINLDTLPDDPKVLKALLGKMMQRMNCLEEQFRLAQHQRFGANGEAHPGQGELFNEADKACGCCGHELHCIGEDVSQKLKFIPAQVKVI